MAFDKTEKSSGTRHKARECALQMLFANDVVTQEGFCVNDYWGELGFEQFHKGANQLIWSFLVSLDNLEKFVEALRLLLKRVDPLNRHSSRFEKLKELDALNALVRKEYRVFVQAIVDNSSPDSEPVKNALANFSSYFPRWVADFLAFVDSDKSRPFVDERKEFSDTCNRVRNVIDELGKQTLPAIDAMLEAVTVYRNFADQLALGTIENIQAIDDRIRTRAEHWRIERMAIVDRNVLRLAVFEFFYQETPQTVAINEALELARKFSTFEATQFINGILDGIKQDTENAAESVSEPERKKASRKSNAK